MSGALKRGSGGALQYLGVSSCFKTLKLPEAPACRDVMALQCTVRN